jgi:GR25 family glycosyltransferase involved in LPS biosynthesis
MSNIVDFTDYPVFVIHYTPLKDRKKSLSAQLQREGLSERAHWIENFDREQISEWPELNDPKNELSKGVIAVGLAHGDAIRRISESAQKYGLVLEDDAILKVGAEKQIRDFCKEVPEDWDMIFIGDACKFHIPLWRRRPGKHIYLKENTKTWWGGDGASRCADSYFVSKKGALSLLDARAMKRPFTKPIDWAFNDAIREKNLKIYWVEPSLATQGSQAGKFEAASYQQ